MAREYEYEDDIFDEFDWDNDDREVDTNPGKKSNNRTCRNCGQPRKRCRCHTKDMGKRWQKKKKKRTYKNYDDGWQ